MGGGSLGKFPLGSYSTGMLSRYSFVTLSVCASPGCLIAGGGKANLARDKGVRGVFLTRKRGRGLMGLGGVQGVRPRALGASGSWWLLLTQKCGSEHRMPPLRARTGTKYRPVPSVLLKKVLQ